MGSLNRQQAAHTLSTASPHTVRPPVHRIRNPPPAAPSWGTVARKSQSSSAVWTTVMPALSVSSLPVLRPAESLKQLVTITKLKWRSTVPSDAAAVLASQAAITASLYPRNFTSSIPRQARRSNLLNTVSVTVAAARVQRCRNFDTQTPCRPPVATDPRARTCESELLYVL